MRDRIHVTEFHHLVCQQQERPRAVPECLRPGAAHKRHQMCFASLVKLFGLEALWTKVIEGGVHPIQDVPLPDARDRSSTNLQDIGDVIVIQTVGLEVGLEQDARVGELTGGSDARCEERLQVGAFLCREVHRVCHAPPYAFCQVERDDRPFLTSH